MVGSKENEFSQHRIRAQTFGESVCLEQVASLAWSVLVPGKGYLDDRGVGGIFGLVSAPALLHNERLGLDIDRLMRSKCFAVNFTSYMLHCSLCVFPMDLYAVSRSAASRIVNQARRVGVQVVVSMKGACPIRFVEDVVMFPGQLIVPRLGLLNGSCRS